MVLADGTTFTGSFFGPARPVAGEVVFNTAMTGYVETLTDPSYAGQILVTTYPLIGNYGVPAPRAPDSLAGPFESSRIQPQALIVQTYVDAYSHGAAERSLRQWLCDDDVPAVTGIDTRALTRHLRESGTSMGWLYPAEMSHDEAVRAASSVDMRQEVFERVAPAEVVTYGEGDVSVLLVDVGAKDNLVRSMLQRGVRVVRAPWHARLGPLADVCDGVLLSNGPGDPRDLGALVDQVRGLVAQGNKPLFGVCLGNQILALAVGGATCKLPYGHRSVNQPVQDLVSGRSYITSQNHGYAVLDQSLPTDVVPWFVNANDGTNEGIRSRSGLFSSVQFHPEACPGPTDTAFLFDDFLRLAGAMKKR